MYKKKKKSGYLQLAVSRDWRKLAVNGYRPKKKKKKKKKSCVKSVTLLTTSLYRINVLNDYMRFFTGLYCESLI